MNLGGEKCALLKVGVHLFLPQLNAYLTQMIKMLFL